MCNRRGMTDATGLFPSVVADGIGSGRYIDGRRGTSRNGEC